MPDGQVGPILAATGCVLLVALVVVATVLSARRRRRRSGQLLAWAQANGWTLSERPPVNWGRRLPGGNRNGVAVALSGQARGRPVTVAEYSVTEVQTTTVSDGVGGVGTSTTANTHFYVVVVTRVLRPLPDIEVEPRAGLARLLRGRASSSGDRRFDRAFRVRTADPAAISAWCTAPLIRAHLDGVVPAWALTGTELMTVEPVRLRPAAITAHADRAAYLAALLDQGPAR